jgi:general secretion pathway protein G
MHNRSVMRIEALSRRYLRTRRVVFGFTLIELLVVFTLLALLLSIAVPRYISTTETARDKVRGQNMATLRDAIDKFKADQGRYPSELLELVSKQYLRKVPEDPVTGSTSWTPLPSPGAVEPGIYDVAPPGPASTQSTAGKSATPAAGGASAVN